MSLQPILLLAAIASIGCWPDEPTDEIDNPRLFRVVAELRGPAGHRIYDERAASFRCLRFTCEGEREAPTKSTSYEITFDDPQPEGCRCAGSYVLETTDGLRLAFMGRAALGEGTEANTDNERLVVEYQGARGEGRVLLSESYRLEVDGGDAYAIDISGGFEAAVGPYRFLRGTFYSRPAEVE